MNKILSKLISLFVILSILPLNGVFADGENVDPWDDPELCNFFNPCDGPNSSDQIVEQTVIGITIGLVAMIVAGFSGKGPLSPTLQRTNHRVNPMNTREEPYTADTHWRNKETSYGNPGYPEARVTKKKTRSKNKKKKQKTRNHPRGRDGPEEPYNNGEQRWRNEDWKKDADSGLGTTG